MPRHKIYADNAEKQAAYRKRKKSKRLMAHFQSLLDVRETPADLFATLDREFGFEVDMCAAAERKMLALLYSGNEWSTARVGWCMLHESTLWPRNRRMAQKSL